MTTGIDRKPAAWRVRWAAEQLGVGVGATPAEARAAFLARLPEEDFVPPMAWRAALRLLTGAADGLPPDAEEEARADEERRLGEAVEAFATEYWSLAVPTRQRRWQALAAASTSFVRLQARLNLLRAGLDVGPLAANSPEVVELARHLEVLFVLPPGERMAARVELRERLRPDMPAWERAAALLSKRYPARTRLLPAVMVELLTWSRQRIWLGKQRQRPFCSASRNELAGDSKPSYSWVYWLVFLAFGMGARAAGCSKDQPPSHAPTPTWHHPTPPTPSSLEEIQKNLREKLRRKLKPEDDNDPLFEPPETKRPEVGPPLPRDGRSP